jgi:hypothetical protein
MENTLTLLVAAHLLGDFVFQTDRMVANKSRPAVFVLHVLIVTLCAGVLVGSVSPLVLLGTAISHAATDLLKMRWSRSNGDGWRVYLADQAAHFAAAVAIARLAPDAFAGGIWPALLTPPEQRGFLVLATLVAGIVLAVPFGGHLIAKLTAPLMRQIPDDNFKDGLTRGGQYIGYLERAFVFLLIQCRYPDGIGFVIAAKSILRFGELKDREGRRLSEYVIIGTFLSFGWGLGAAELTRHTIAYHATATYQTGVMPAGPTTSPAIAPHSTPFPAPQPATRP